MRGRSARHDATDPRRAPGAARSSRRGPAVRRPARRPARRARHRGTPARAAGAHAGAWLRRALRRGVRAVQRDGGALPRTGRRCAQGRRAGAYPAAARLRRALRGQPPRIRLRDGERVHAGRARRRRAARGGRAQPGARPAHAAGGGDAAVRGRVRRRRASRQPHQRAAHPRLPGRARRRQSRARRRDHGGTGLHQEGARGAHRHHPRGLLAQPARARRQGRDRGRQAPDPHPERRHAGHRCGRAAAAPELRPPQQGCAPRRDDVGR